MLYRKNGEWALCPHKVRYTQRGEELEQYTSDPQWWIDFANIWAHTEIVEISEVVWTEEEIARLEEIKHISEGYSAMCVDYVRSGEFPDEKEHKVHPLQYLRQQKENEKQGQNLSEREIQEIIQGQQLSDLDIRLLMGGL